jgi:hypothetical protein
MITGKMGFFEQILLVINGIETAQSQQDTKVGNVAMIFGIGVAAEFFGDARNASATDQTAEHQQWMPGKG